MKMPVKKVWVLILVILISLSSTGGYLFLSRQIIAGEIRIAEGQLQIKEGENTLAKGKAKLAHGQRKLSNAKKVYYGIKSIPLVNVASILPVTKEPFKQTGNKISQGDYLVAQGKKKIKSGEAQLAAGKEELATGISRINQAKFICTLLGISAIVFWCLTILLAISFKLTNNNKPRNG